MINQMKNFFIQSTLFLVLYYKKSCIKAFQFEVPKICNVYFCSTQHSDFGFMYFFHFIIDFYMFYF